MINRRGWTVVSLGATILTFLIAAPADAAALRPNQIDVEYVPPKSSAHDALYKLVRERRLLEKIRDLLVPFRLPRRLLLKTTGCDGVINAWYDDAVITVCYEYLDWVWQSAPQQTTPALIAGAAYQYKSGVQSENQSIATKRFADVHGTMAQRFFNILCLAYGADNELFKDIVAEGYLPKERAEGCSDEYAQVAYAFKTLIGPYIDRNLAAKLHRSWLPPINSPPPRRPEGLDRSDTKPQ
jgi:hypothetical protein